MRRTWTILAALAALLAFAPAARAAEFVVTSALDVGGECTPEQCTIRQALGSAAATPTESDVVIIPAGTYTLTLGALVVNSAVTLRGADARTTTIAAGTAARVLEIGTVTARVETVTLSGGTATAAGGFHGGNVRNQGGNVTLDRVRVTGGRAYSGGGIANRNGQMPILNSLIDRNQAPDGGGDGGGIINFGGDGGGAAALTVQNSTLAFNTARLAGALISYGNVEDRVTLDGVTVARNSGGDRGVGGISFGADSGVLSARSTVVADNIAQGLPSNCGGGQALASQGWNVESGTECGFTQEVDQRGVDALLGSELVNAGGPTDVLLPSPLSPAINVNGNLTVCGGTDQRGVTRPKGPRCDAGAVELEYEVRIDAATFAGSGATFAFSSGRSPVLFDCALDRPGGPVAQFGPCSGIAGADYTGLAPGEYTFRVRALVAARRSARRRERSRSSSRRRRSTPDPSTSVHGRRASRSARVIPRPSSSACSCPTTAGSPAPRRGRVKRCRTALHTRSASGRARPEASSTRRRRSGRSSSTRSPPASRSPRARRA